MPTLRPATPSDLSRIIEIAASTPDSAQWPADEYAKFFPSEDSSSQPVKSPSQEIGGALTSAPQTVQHHAFLVAEDEQTVQGFVVGRGVGDEWEIENIAVIQSRQRRGVGRLLLTEFLRLIREHGGTNVFLEVRESNRAARLLYEKAGFVEIGRRKAYYQSPPEDAAILKISFS